VADDAQRLTAVEEKLAHLERYASDLDSVIRDAFAEIDRLRKALTRLEDKFAAQADTAEDESNHAPDPERDRPPHW
jgi:uncharacterized coiled-coil protein SlyX